MDSLFDIMLSIHMVYDSKFMGELYSCVFMLVPSVFILYSCVFYQYSRCILHMHRMSIFHMDDIVFVCICMYLYVFVCICTVFVCIPYVFVGIQCPECDGNPAELICLCKGFKHVGICSHVLAANHTIKAHNVEYMLSELIRPQNKGRHVSKKGRRIGGNMKRMTGALKKQKQCKDDSDSESEHEDHYPHMLNFDPK